MGRPAWVKRPWRPLLPTKWVRICASPAGQPLSERATWLQSLRISKPATSFIDEIHGQGIEKFSYPLGRLHADHHRQGQPRYGPSRSAKFLGRRHHRIEGKPPLRVAGVSIALSFMMLAKWSIIRRSAKILVSPLRPRLSPNSPPVPPHTSHCQSVA